ncbi:MAG: FAD-dependent oxidoreductase [Candidatus Methanomethylicia archaeon]
MSKSIIIIGCGAAGLSAALSARKTDRNVNITIIDQEEYPAYSRCALPFVIGGEINDFNSLLTFSPSMYKMMKIDLRLRSKVIDVDPKSRTIVYINYQGREETLQYDSLILATGASPMIPSISGVNKRGVYVLRTINDCKAIVEALPNSRNAIVIGAGLIGLETADALYRRGLNVTIIEILPSIIRTNLDEDMAEIVKSNIEGKGVRILVNRHVDEITGSNRVDGVISNGERLKADIVVLATGIKANIELANRIGIQIGITGAIKVNSRMETTVKDIYAVGDCVESNHMVTGQAILSQLGTTAVKQGRVAGINAAGGYAVFPGVLNSVVSRIFNLEVGVTGLNMLQAEKYGFKVLTGSISWKTRAEYYPEAKSIRVKLLFERGSLKIIGGQIVGGEFVAPRIDSLALAIQAGMTVFDIINSDTCYSPPLANTWSPITLAAEAALSRIRVT